MAKGAPLCLIHFTCLLYTDLNVVNSILWQTLHYYQLQHALTGVFLYPRASENLDDVSQKATNQHSSSIRTMKSSWPIHGTPSCRLTNHVQAPPRVMLESWRLKTLRIAYVPSHTAIAEHWDPAVVARVSITHSNILSLRNDGNIPKYLERVFKFVKYETGRWLWTFLSFGNEEKNNKNSKRLAGNITLLRRAV